MTPALDVQASQPFPLQVADFVVKPEKYTANP